MNNNSAERLAKYGPTGVAIASLILLGFTINLLYTFATNHISSVIDVVESNTRTEERLIGVIENLDGSVVDLGDLLKGR